ncbi:MAG TPA: sulfite exporter TauE/SafE family protein [Verrucomicrobiae bacterium]|jgi:hypothetical protein
MSLVEALTLAAAAGAAGVVNAVAGGGTMITFPSLLFFGTPGIVANATSTLALVIGTSSSIYAFRKQLAAVKPWLKRFVPISLLGGLVGSILLTHTQEKVFAKLVPFLLLFATILFLLQGFFRKLSQPKDPAEEQILHGPALAGAIVFQFFVSVYGGYFGAGIGILMLASFGILGLRDIHEMNAIKNLVGSLINQVAAIYFIFAGLIDWPKAGVMTLGALIGYFLGAHYSQRISQKRVRQIITAVGFTISAVLFYQQFARKIF